MILRDPVHGLVSFESKEEGIIERLMATAQVQRLRRIRQLGFTSLAYPGADHTRFSHSLGAAHVMTRFVRRLRDLHHELPPDQRLDEDRAREALAAALLHDVGHGPFSHLFESALPDAPSHETWTVRLLQDPQSEVNQVLTEYDSDLPTRVADLVQGKHPLEYLAHAVSGTFDVDRCDYLLRDAHFTGVGYGRFDLDWLLRSLRLGVPNQAQQAPPLAIDGPKGLPAIESFVLARLFMFQQVYFHKASRASEWMLSRVLNRVRVLILQGTKLPALPQAIVDLALNSDTSMEAYQSIDDMVLWECLRAWRSAPDAILADLATRLFARRLHKTYELYGQQVQPQWRDEAHAIVRDIAARANFDPDSHVGLDVAEDTPFNDSDAAIVVLFPNGRARAPREVSVLLRRLSGEPVERVRLIFPPEIRPQVVAALDVLPLLGAQTNV
jgi:HD superfamily phosphohydrolase